MDTRYFCENCNSSRIVDVLENPLNAAIKNGLRVQTHIHRCENGLLQVYNLFVDDDQNTRTIEQIEVPELKNKKRKILNLLPTPAKMDSERGKIKNILVTSISSKPGMRLLIKDAVAKYTINIGNVEPEKEKPEFTVYSFLNTLELAYYNSQITPNQATEIWLQEFINTIEKLPPIHLGQYLEGLRYIQGLCVIPPLDDDFKVLEMILTGSEITFSLLKKFDPADFLDPRGGNRFEGKTLTRLFKLVSKIENKPSMTLDDYAIAEMSDIIFLCKNFLVLEELGVIEINRPDTFNLEEFLSENI